MHSKPRGFAKLLPLALLAGGLATRMRPMTTTIPKSLLNVAGEPFIAHQLRLFRRQGIERVVACVGWLGEQIEDFVGNGERFDLQVAYSFDGERLMGTGGALVRALPLLGEEFLVCYGDSYLDSPYRPVIDYFHSISLPALMTVYRNEDRWDRSNIDYEDGRIRRYDKESRTKDTRYIDYGLAILHASALTRRSSTERFDLADIYRGLVASGELAGFEVDRRFYEIGSVQGLADTDAYLRGQCL